MLRRLNVDDLPQTGLQVKVVYLCYYDNSVGRSKQNTDNSVRRSKGRTLEKTSQANAPINVNPVGGGGDCGEGEGF